MKNSIFLIDEPTEFTFQLNRLFLESERRNKIDQDHVISDFLNYGGFMASNGIDCLVREVYSYPRITKLCDFIETIGCPELAAALKRIRDIFYKGRTDLLTIEAAWAAGFKYDNMTREDYLEMSAIEDEIMGDSGLGIKSLKPFMEYIKAHPELIKDVL